MKIEQNPFSIYDFLGYLIPGMFFLYACIFIYNGNYMDFSIDKKIDLQFDQYLILIILSYIVGHILSYISSITVELFSIWSVGYPSRYLLNLPFPGFWRNIFSNKNKIECGLKIVMVFAIFPVTITDFVIRKVFKIKKLLGKSADKFTICLIEEEIPKYLSKTFTINNNLLPLNKKENDFFNIIYHYSLENCTAHASKMQNYVALYGFTRTICFSLIMIIWLIILNGFGGTFSINTTKIIIILAVLSGILYLAFNKFYRKFSLESFMAFLSMAKKDRRTTAST